MTRTLLKCEHCEHGPCVMVESINAVGYFPSTCMKKKTTDYVEWVRIKEKRKMLVIRQPKAMKREIQEFLSACMNTGSGSKNLEIIQTVSELIDQYTADVGEHL